MIRRPVLFFNPCRCAETSAAIFALFLAISLDAARAECVLSENNMALARIVTKEAKVYFVSGPRKQAPECPSRADLCRLKAYLVPGDKIPGNVTDDPYVSANVSFNGVLCTTNSKLQQSTIDDRLRSGVAHLKVKQKRQIN